MERSLIVYTHNSEKYIQRLIRSILEQIDVDNEQLIIVDDMSTDNTVPIIIQEIGYWFTEEDKFKLYINTTEKGKKESVEMAKQIASGNFKFIINKKGRVKI